MDLFNLDLVLCSVRPDWRQEIVAEPHFAANPEVCEVLRWYGFQVGFPLKVWRGYILPHAQTLLDGPVLLFGQKLRNYGWFARVAPMVPVRSTDQMVWLYFYDPSYQDAWLAKHKLAGTNNLTCAPGVRELLSSSHA